MKVLFLIDTLAVGGAERSLLEILRRFESTTPHLCYLYRGDDLRAAYEGAGIPVTALGLGARYGFFRAIARLRDVIRGERPDLIHTTLFRSDIVGRLAGWLEGVPVVSSFVNESYSPERWARLSLGGRVRLGGVQLLDALTARLATRYVAISETVRGTESRALRLPLNRVSVIHRGRDPAVYRTVLGKSEEASLRSELGLPSKGPVVLNTARLLRRKGQEELILAFRELLVTHPDAHLLIAGEGGHRDALTARIRDSGVERSVHLIGRREDVPDLLALADLFVFPSHFEGHGGALLEAMFAAKPIVASDIPVHRESVRDGETARLVPVSDPRSLARAMASLLEDRELASALGSRARAEAVRRFDITRIVREHEALYARILGSGTPDGGAHPLGRDRAAITTLGAP